MEPSQQTAGHHLGDAIDSAVLGMSGNAAFANQIMKVFHLYVTTVGYKPSHGHKSSLATLTLTVTATFTASL
jgi:hypothetical protein